MLLKKTKLKITLVCVITTITFTEKINIDKTFFIGRKIAVDASMSLYQFLIAVRAEGVQLTAVDGSTTSHLMGMFYRTIRLVENGIKPVYVFDGKPPQMKSAELNKRQERRVEAEKALAKATEEGDQTEIDKFNRRLVKVTKEHAQEAKELLTLMGVPYIEAPCEAEAQCAALVFHYMFILRLKVVDGENCF